MGVHLESWAGREPARPFLCERSAAGTWKAISYSEMLLRIRRIGAALLAAGLSPERPLAILSENSIEHALLMVAAMHVGIPCASISPAYSRISSDYGKLRRIIACLDPGLIYATDGIGYGQALRAIQGLHTATVVLLLAVEQVPEARPFDSLEVNVALEKADQAYKSVGPETVAKLLYTSGSTDEPKGVIVTQRMLTSNQQARSQVWPFLNTMPPVVVDWLPWSHTFGGNHNLNLVLRFGGTLYIDAGRPVPSLFATTIANLKEISPNIHFNVPRGYDLLVDALKRDAELRERFFKCLKVIFYAAAALPQHLWDAMIELARETMGFAPPIVSAWGSTETAPLVTDCHFHAPRAGVIGVPVPGCELKLVANGTKMEARVRGPNVTPGYWKRPDLTASHFDDEGFYIIGDAVRFVDEGNPNRGLLFDGRVAEDFKLDSGTWVNTNKLRLGALSVLAPLVQDIVLTGHDRPDIGFLLIPNLSACRALCRNLPFEAPTTELLGRGEVRAAIATRLGMIRDAGGGRSSTHAARALLMVEPPSIDAGEITDKGYVNQRAVLANRKDLVRRLYEIDSSEIIRPA